MEMLPNHLKKYVVEQNYEKYTPVDHAVWRFILRQLKSFLSVHAHASYLDGLERTGIEIEKIPSIADISKKLSQFGWRAVPVSGFIPPAAFMELQSLSVLPIASDIRSLDHLLYTPAPDIVHEAAGHAPILADKEFADYLRQYAQVAKKSILSREDLDMYEAIRTLSDLKEHGDSTPEQIQIAEDHLNEISKSITYISEAAELARMNWWTAEYGLVGPLDNPKIFGAGLLSSVGESRWCLSSKVKKIPLSKDCVKFSYDITEPQPQLFVTPDFKHLGKVLNDFADTMAYKIGGLEGVNKAIKAKSVNTVELDSGIQISGQVIEAITDASGNVIYLRFDGPSQLSYKDKELPGHDIKYHSHGFGTPVGNFKQNGNLLEFSSGVKVTGDIKSKLERDGKTLVMTLTNAKAEYQGRVLFEPSWGNFDIALGTKVTSVFGGAADREAFGDSKDFVVAKVPPAKTTEKDRSRYNLYSEIRKLREMNTQGSELEKSLNSVLTKIRNEFSDDWLPYLEVYELVLARIPNSKIKDESLSELSRISKKYPEKADVIKDGINLAPQS